MSPNIKQKIILVKRKTRLDDLVARFNTVDQVKFYLEHLGGDFNDYQSEHEQYYRSAKEAEIVLSEIGQVQIVDRLFVPNFIFGKDDIIVAVGQDGLVANTLKYLNNQPLIGVNPDPGRWDGVLLPFNVKDLKVIISELQKNQRKIKEVTIAQATLNDGQTLYAVNDFFVGHKSHVSARYKIRVNNVEEQHSSSGIIVSTGMGSSAWFKSLMIGAVTITKQLLNNKINIKPQYEFPWDSDFLYYTVREPFPSKTSGASLVFGKITRNKPLTVISQMAENGVIFSDGIETDFISFNSGIQATFHLAGKKGRLVV